jgi:hypothetical protein
MIEKEGTCIKTSVVSEIPHVTHELFGVEGDKGSLLTGILIGPR